MPLSRGWGPDPLPCPRRWTAGGCRALPVEVARPARAGGRCLPTCPGCTSAVSAPSRRPQRPCPPTCENHLRLRQGSGYEQAEAELCRVEVDEVAVALGPPA